MMSSSKDELQRINCNLIIPQTETGSYSILVVSAKSGEGCTTIAFGLAREMAEDKGLNVLIVDANLRKPDLHRRAARQEPSLHKEAVEGQELGLVNVLLERSELDEVIRDTDIENLKVLTSGEVNANPASLFSKGQFARMLAAASRKFDRIVIDSCALVDYPDSIILAPQVDAVIQVIHAGKTNHMAAQEGLRQLEQTEANVIGAVLNRTRHVIPEWLYKRL